MIAYTRELINSPKAGLGFSFSSLINFEFLSKFIEYMYSPKVAITNRASVFLIYQMSVVFQSKLQGK